MIQFLEKTQERFMDCSYIYTTLQVPVFQLNLLTANIDC